MNCDDRFLEDMEGCEQGTLVFVDSGGPSGDLPEDVENFLNCMEGAMDAYRRCKRGDDEGPKAPREPPVIAARIDVLARLYETGKLPPKAGATIKGFLDLAVVKRFRDRHAASR